MPKTLIEKCLLTEDEIRIALITSTDVFSKSRERDEVIVKAAVTHAIPIIAQEIKNELEKFIIHKDEDGVVGLLDVVYDFDWQSFWGEYLKCPT